MPFVIGCACGVTVQGDSPEEVVDKAAAHQEDHRDDSVPVPREVLAEMVERG